MPKFYCYIERDDGTEPMGTSNTFLVSDLKTLKGVINRLKRFTPVRYAMRQRKTLVIKQYTNIFDDSTFKEVHREVLTPPKPTLQEMKGAKHGNTFRIKGRNWRVNGKVKTWKRDPSRVHIPVKHGLYNYGYVTEKDLPFIDWME